ncbi:hypothetical protein AVEN_94568-1 [Araneus ventricosus]|uniref:Uncharacterized protein n=1 Tax=Araneus ventricosus TaxID=182803 RepID=A0A4Y2ISF1_ARAVE|nr:hypothetical protein AVEN_94568-1 [Araneus ventricosus]
MADHGRLRSQSVKSVDRLIDCEPMNSRKYCCKDLMSLSCFASLIIGEGFLQGNPEDIQPIDQLQQNARTSVPQHLVGRYQWVVNAAFGVSRNFATCPGNVEKCNHNRTFCGSATHQMAPPIYYWSTDALICACTKSFSSTRNEKEEGSSNNGDLGQ